MVNLLIRKNIKGPEKYGIFKNREILSTKMFVNLWYIPLSQNFFTGVSTFYIAFKRLQTALRSDSRANSDVASV